jgi:hypothetical protein
MVLMEKPIGDLSDLIRDHNIPAHIEIQEAMRRKKNGLFTMTLRVNSGNIVDTVELEYYAYPQTRA